MSEENPVIKKTVVTMAQLSADEKIRQQCIARQMYEADRKSSYLTGKEDERNLIRSLNRKLIQVNRGNELNDALENPQVMDKLIKEFNITTK